MPGQPDYKALDIYQLSKKLVAGCYEITHRLPPEEKTNLTQYIRTAAVTLHLNIAQGTFLKKRKKRKKLIRIIQNALLVINAALEVLVEVGFIEQERTTELTDLTSALFDIVKDSKKQK